MELMLHIKTNGNISETLNFEKYFFFRFTRFIDGLRSRRNQLVNYLMILSDHKVERKQRRVVNKQKLLREKKMENVKSHNLLCHERTCRTKEESLIIKKKTLKHNNNKKKKKIS